MIWVDIMPRDHASLLNLHVADEPVNELNADGADAAFPPGSRPEDAEGAGMAEGVDCS